jgi:hypothetical protein
MERKSIICPASLILRFSLKLLFLYQALEPKNCCDFSNLVSSSFLGSSTDSHSLTLIVHHFSGNGELFVSGTRSKQIDTIGRYHYYHEICRVRLKCQFPSTFPRQCFAFRRMLCDSVCLHLICVLWELGFALRWLWMWRHVVWLTATNVNARKVEATGFSRTTTNIFHSSRRHL